MPLRLVVGCATDPRHSAKCLDQGIAVICAGSLLYLDCAVEIGQASSDGHFQTISMERSNKIYRIDK